MGPETAPLSPTPRTTVLAIISFLLSITSFVLGLFTGIAAVVLGLVSLRRINRSGGRLKGEMLATAAIVTSIMSAIFSATLLKSIQSAREAAQRSTALCKMMGITLALQNYADQHPDHKFPAPGGGDERGSQLSWRVHLLPYLDEDELFGQFHLDEPWDSEHNRKLIAKMPGLFDDPSCDLPEGETCFLAVTGPGTAFGDGRTAPSMSDLQKRKVLSHTALIVEANADQAVIWTKPDDWQFDPKNPKRGVAALRPSGFVVGFGDGHVETISNRASPEDITAEMTGRVQ